MKIKKLVKLVKSVLYQEFASTLIEFDVSKECNQPNKGRFISNGIVFMKFIHNNNLITYSVTRCTSVHSNKSISKNNVDELLSKALIGIMLFGLGPINMVEVLKGGELEESFIIEKTAYGGTVTKS